LPKFYFYIDGRKLKSPRPGAAYFHAQYRQEYPCVSGRNYLFCDVKDGKGHFAGVSLSIQTAVAGWWGEGDDIFTVDGEAVPSIWGTGSEDYFSGAWGFGKEFYTPYFGMPLRTRQDHTADNFWNVYRLHLEAPITFEKSLRAEMEHGDNGVSNRRNGGNNHYSSVAYFYVDTPHPLSEKLPPSEQRAPVERTQALRPGLIEAQAMDRRTPDKGELEVQGVAQFSRGKIDWLNKNQLFRKGASVGDETLLMFQVKEAMEGPAALVVSSANDYGRISVSLDGETVVRSFDAYSEKVEPVLINLGKRTLKPGEHSLKIKILGKNDRSVDHFWGVDYLRVGGTPPETEQHIRQVQ
jgi:hypothetical protein